MYNVPKDKISQFIFLALTLVNFLNKKLAVLSHDNTKKKIRLTSYKAFYLKLISICIHAT